MPPLLDSDYCWVHHPDNADAVLEARRLGGLRRRREGTLAAAFEVSGLTSVPEIRRLIEIAALDTLGLDNGVARNRTLLAAAMTALKALETGDQEERIRALEAAVLERTNDSESPFDTTEDNSEFPTPEDAA
jgi:hypothetical protein